MTVSFVLAGLRPSIKAFRRNAQPVPARDCSKGFGERLCQKAIDDIIRKRIVKRRERRWNS